MLGPFPGTVTRREGWLTALITRCCRCLVTAVLVLVAASLASASLALEDAEDADYNRMRSLEDFNYNFKPFNNKRSQSFWVDIFSIYLLCIGNYYLMIMSDCDGVINNYIVQVTFLDKLGHEKGEKRGRYYGGTNYNDAVFRGLG